jgi:hypothetical protein
MREASKHERSMLVKSSLHSLLQLRDHLTSQLSGLKVRSPLIASHYL